MSIDNDPNRSIDTKGIPHSGIHHGEQPVNEFDKTTLSQAVEQGLITTPDTPGVLPEAQPTVPNHESIWRRTWVKVVAGVGAIAIAGGAFWAGTQSNADHKGDAPITDPGQTGEIQIPDEARDFVDRNGPLYVDPLATYYAETAYEQANPGQGLVLDEAYAASYDFNVQPFANGETSPLGFTVERMSPELPINADSSLAQFNESIPNLNRIINLIAKNPSSATIEAIKDEFSKYSGLSNTDAENLIGLAQFIVQRFGSNANYSVNEAIKDNGESKTDTTVLVDEQPVIDAVDTDGNTIAFSNIFNISLKVESYDDKGEVSTQDILVPNVQFSVNQAKDYDPNNSGYVGIGIRGSDRQYQIVQ